MAKLLYQGKTKQLWSTDKSDVLRVVYKDDTTALDGEKHDQFAQKGELTCEISALIFNYLNQNGVKTAFIKKTSKTEQYFQKLKMIDLEVVTRNLAAGHFCKRYGIEKEGMKLTPPVEELFMKSDALHDPLMNESDAIALGYLTDNEFNQIWKISRQVNHLLIPLFRKINLELVDFKLEFGTANDEVYLGDEFSPDNCRLWDLTTNAHMDKDVYRREIGNLMQVYTEVASRLRNELGESHD